MKEIKRKNGSVRYTAPVCEGSVHKKKIMSEDYVELHFSTDKAIAFERGDYIEMPRGRYEIVDFNFPTFNEATAAYDYRLRFDADYWKWKNKLFFYTRQGNKEASWNLTYSPDGHLEVVIDNLKMLGYQFNGKDYTFEIHDTVDRTAKHLSYDGIHILDALTRIAEAWDCEWWVQDNIIHLGKCEYPGDTVFELGGNVQSMSRSESQDNHATRIYAFGSTRNLPVNYRENEGIVVNGVVQKRLMLPAGVECIDAYNDMEQEQAVEEIVVFDDIYPRRIGTMSEVTPILKTGTVENKDGTTTEETWNVYRYKDAELNFADEYQIEGEELRIVFTSGALNGLSFEVNFFPNEIDENGKVYQVWEINRNEDYGTFLPNDNLKPADGDTYILAGYDTEFVSAELLPEAEEELEKRAIKYVEKSKEDPSVYDCEMNLQEMSAEEVELDLGSRVKLINPGFFQGSRESRIYGFEKHLDGTKVKFTVGNSAKYSRLAQVEQEIKEISYDGNVYAGSGSGGVYVISRVDSTPPSDRNVFSALRSAVEFISKKANDFTHGLITFFKGIKIGNYQEGMTGEGAYIDEHGVAEMTGLRLREFLEVPELRFNRIDVVSGEQWNAPGFGIIESVDTEKQIVTLKLEEGELAGVKLNDYCRGIFHNVSGNTDPSVIDECGFPTLPGFTTAYFTPVEMLEDGKSFRYSLRPGTTAHPYPSMKFAVYGNATDTERQASAYSTPTYKRYLKNVDTWKITMSNIAMQFGDCSGLTINNMPLKKYSAYLDNIYITGTMEWIKEHIEELDLVSTYSVSLSASEAVLPLNNSGEIDASLFDVVNIVNGTEKYRNETGESSRKIRTALEVFRGTTMLQQGESIDTNTYIVDMEAQGCKYEIQAGIITITEVSEDNAVLNININCEGVAKFSKTFSIVRVYSEKGDAGADGPGFELIFKRTTELKVPERPTSANQDMYIPEGWTDDQQGTSPEWPYEYTCKRTKTNGRWSSFSIPALWASYSSDGRDGYSVALSSYDAVVGVNANGEVDRSLYDIENIVSGEERAYSEANPLVTTRYKVQTKVYAFNGNRSLEFSDTPEAGKFSVMLVPVGCTCRVDDGTVTVLSLTEDKASVEVLVNCEGRITFSQKFSVTRVYSGTDGVSPYSLNLTNDSATVPADKNGVVQDLTLASTTVQLFLGTELVENATFQAESNPSQVTFRQTGDTFVISGIPDNVDTAKLNIVALVNGQPVGTIVFTVTKVRAGEDGTPATIHYLSIPVSVVKRNDAGVADPASISVSAMMVVGNQTPVESVNFTIKYKRSDDTAWNTGSTIPITGSTQYVDIELRDNATNALLDAERVPVVTDGKKGDKGDPGEQGKTGIQGCIIRKSEWREGVTYRNDEHVSEEAQGTRYLDVALVRNNGVTSGWDVYKCKKTHENSTLQQAPGVNSDLWEKFETNSNAIFTSLIVANDARIDFVSGNELNILNDLGKPAAGISGTQDGDKTRIWAGGESPDTANFRVNEDGKLSIANNKIILEPDGSGWLAGKNIKWGASGDVRISGEINATSGNIGDISIKGKDLVGLNELGEEKVRISLSEIPPIDAISSTKYPDFTMESLTDDVILTRKDSVRNNMALFSAIHEKGGLDNTTMELTVKFDVPIATEAIFRTFVNFELTDGFFSGPLVCRAFLRKDSNEFEYLGNISEMPYDITMTIPSAGTYTLWFVVQPGDGYWESSWSGNITLWLSRLVYVHPPNFTLIGSNGYASIFGSTNYLYFNEDYGFEVRVGRSGLRIQDNILKIFKNGGWTDL